MTLVVPFDRTNAPMDFASVRVELAMDEVIAALQGAQSIEVRAPGVVEPFSTDGAAEALDGVLTCARR